MMSELFSGADARIRTADLLITNQLLCQLSYIGIHQEMRYLYEGNELVNTKSPPYWHINN